jgi:solute carrier family 50 protein (sugar transporter)
MTGNCLGWIVYGYYTNDVFVYAANVPGLVLSIWLNLGASKLQYLELQKQVKEQERQQLTAEDWNASPAGMRADDDDDFVDDHVPDNAREPDEALTARQASLVFVPQETALFRILAVWAGVITYVSWFSKQDPAATVGIVVNFNLVFFYGSPLQTIHTVVAQRNSESIHLPTMMMNWTNTTFWILYGFARHDFVIMVPNGLGLSLGLVQGLLCFLYPRTRSQVLVEPLNPDEERDSATAAVAEDTASTTNGISSATLNTIV